MKKQNANNRLTHFLCGITKGHMPEEDLNEEGKAITPTSWLRILPVTDLDIPRTFSVSTYEGFVNPTHFNLLNKILDEVYREHSNGRSVPSALLRPMRLPTVDISEISVEAEVETQHGRKIKPVNIFDPALQRITDMEMAAAVVPKKRKGDVSRRSSKKKKIYEEDEELVESQFLQDPEPPITNTVNLSCSMKVTH